MNYDEQFLIEMQYRYPRSEVFIPDGHTIMSESYHCPYCRETLWLVASSDGTIRRMQDYSWFERPECIGEHTDEYCREIYYAHAMVAEYERWVCEHQPQEDEAA